VEAVVSVRVLLQEAVILGLDPDDHDPVRIIRAAQLRLRRFRAAPVADGHGSTQHIRLIIAARDALLKRAVVSLSQDGHRGQGG